MTPILHACSKDNVSIFTLLIKRNANLDAENKSGQNALHIACESKSVNVAKLIIAERPRLIYKTSAEGLMSIHYAAKVGSTETLIFIDEKGYDLKKESKSGKQVLQIACENGHPSVVKFLLSNRKHGDIFRTIGQGWNLIHYASIGGNIEILKMLIDGGLGITDVTDKKASALHIAIANNRMEMVEFLVSNYPKILDFIDVEGYNALHHACIAGNIEIVQFLLDNGLEPMTLTHNSLSLLHIAILHGRLPLANYLIERFPILISLSTSKGFLPIHTAAEKGEVDIITKLCETTVDIKQKTEGGLSPLHVGVVHNQISVVEILTEKAPSLMDLAAKNGYLPVHTAAEKNNVVLLKVLTKDRQYISRKVDNSLSLLHVAVLHNSIEVAKYLIAEYPHLLEERSETGNLPIHTAAEKGFLDLCLVLANVCDVTQCTTKSSFSTLQLSIIHGHLEAVEFMSKNYPILLTLRLMKGLLPIHLAAEKGRVDMIEILQRNGADLHEITTDGYPIINVYLIHNSGTISDLTKLIELGADPSQTTSSGDTILHTACKYGRKELVSHIVSNIPGVLHAINDIGRTALFSAANFGDPDIFEILCRNGLNPMEQPWEGFTVLHSVTLVEEDKTQMCDYLARRFPEMINMKEVEYGCTPCHHVAKFHNLELFKLFESNGGNMTATTKQGNSLLHLACEKANIEVAKYIVSNYPSLLLQMNDSKKLPSGFAKDANSVELLDFLFKEHIATKEKENNRVNILIISVIIVLFAYGLIQF